MFNYIRSKIIKAGFTAEYTKEEKDKSAYRKNKLKISHLRSYRVDLYHYINEEDLKKNNLFFPVTYDVAIFMPMLELSCGRNNRIDEAHYLYSYDTGTNDYSRKDNSQGVYNEIIRAKQKYKCYDEYKNISLVY